MKAMKYRRSILPVLIFLCLNQAIIAEAADDWKPPELILGVYNFADFTLAAGMGFNTIVINGQAGSAESLARLESQLGVAVGLGLGVLPEFSGYVREGRAAFGPLERVVTRLGRVPQIVANYSIDEPSEGRVPVSKQTAAREYEVLKAANPGRPVLLIQNQVSGIADFLGTFDILGIDIYPINETEANLAVVGRSVSTALSVANGAPLWAVIQASRKPQRLTSNRWPRPEEIRTMALLALCHGATGLLFYAADDVFEAGQSGFRFNDPIMAAFPGILAELKVLGPEIVRGPIVSGTVKAVTGGQIEQFLIGSGSNKKLVMINTSPLRALAVPAEEGFGTNALELLPSQTRVILPLVP